MGIHLQTPSPIHHFRPTPKTPTAHHVFPPRDPAASAPLPLPLHQHPNPRLHPKARTHPRKPNTQAPNHPPRGRKPARSLSSNNRVEANNHPRPHRITTKVRAEEVEKDKVPKGFWAGQGGADRQP